MAQNAKHNTILVVDDIPENIQIITATLGNDYQVKAATSGERALEIAEQDPKPDLVLLDIVMPEMDGYEVCKQLKSNEKTREIPVIFVTARGDVRDEQFGFQLGAVDYITKPISPPIVAARVHTHLTVSQQKRSLTTTLCRLRELEDMRDNLVHMVVHDMRAPLMGMMGFLDIFKLQAEERLTDDEVQLIDDLHKQTCNLRDMVNDLLEVSKFENNSMPVNREKTDFTNVVDEAISSLILYNRTIDIQTEESDLTVRVDQELMRRVVANLLSNAMKFSKPEEPVVLYLERLNDYLKVSVIDSGPGIPEDSRSLIFEKFGQVTLRHEKGLHSTGLGLTFCKLAVEAHGGEIGVESELGEGSTFWFTVPIDT
jgi:signal transduction histidine kinase